MPKEQCEQRGNLQEPGYSIIRQRSRQFPNAETVPRKSYFVEGRNGVSGEEIPTPQESGYSIRQRSWQFFNVEFSSVYATAEFFRRRSGASSKKNAYVAGAKLR